LGAAIAVWCVVTFVWIGKGTPAPFDPPRRLVVRGPYRFVRNPMYIGGALALAGAVLFYHSLFLLAYVCIFLLAACLFVLFYEEPTLRRTFGSGSTASGRYQSRSGYTPSACLSVVRRLCRRLRPHPLRHRVWLRRRPCRPHPRDRLPLELRHAVLPAPWAAAATSSPPGRRRAP